MYFTGFADEAATGLADQIRATKELGWSNIESRCIDDMNIHDLPDEAFERVVEQLAETDVHINCFGSAICNWKHRITDPFEITVTEVKRAIPRMQRLGTKLIRIMSYLPIAENDPSDQMEEERFKRLREVVAMFLDNGIQPVHENCNNYGGMGYPFTLRLLEHVPGLKLVFDTGNPVFTRDWSKPKPYPFESSWEFYSNVREFVEYVHIKDGYCEDAKDSAPVFTFPGEGRGDVRRIVADLLKCGYDGGFSIEPHMALVFHDKNVTSPEQYRYDNYVEYGRRFMRLVEEVKADIAAQK